MTHRNLIVLLLLLLSPGISRADSWPQPKGDFYIKLYEWWVIADQHFTDQGLIDPNVTNGVFNSSLYGEYGFTDKLTGILNFPFFSRAYFNNTVSEATGEVIMPGEAVNGLGDAQIGLRYGLVTDKPLVLSVSLTLGLPLGITGGGSTGSLQTGDGEFNQQLRLEAGHGLKLGKMPAYAKAYTGFNQRSQGFSDEFRFGLESGLQFVPDRLWLILRLDGIESLNNGNSVAGNEGSSLFANNSEYLAFTPEVAWYVTDSFGISAAVGVVFYGRLIYANPSWSVGVFYDMP
ncbi:MAG: hypothetical protein GYB31_14770 [Bacteroidetes bacterium]|nr:hypothetical protein [Bacteroidota bacterium]